jgi:cytochrome c-type biogenesis protein CcmH
VSGTARWLGRLAVPGAVVLIGVALTAAVVRQGDRAPTFDQRVDAVAAGLRCPVCQDLSVADSPSSVAAAFRAEIARRLRDGGTPGEVRAYFVSKYGQWILLAPRPTGLNVLPWAAPLAALVVGAGAVGAVLRRRRDPAAPPISAMEQRRVAGALADFEEST